MLKETDKKNLILLARGAVAKRLNIISQQQAPSSTRFNFKPQGIFVTLYKRGELRGCIGTLQLDAPLHDAVARTAEESAFEDPRFPPLQADEYPHVQFEISLLSPLRR